MTPPSSYDESPLYTTLNYATMASETPGTYDALFPAICPHRPDMAPPEGPPRVPPVAATRKTAPIRPVYDDFETAFSSITSRSVKNHHRISPKKSPGMQQDILNKDQQIFRRTQTLGGQIGHSKFDRSPGKLTTAGEIFRRELSDADLDVTNVNFSSTRPPQLQLTVDRSPKHKIQKPSSPSRVFGSIKKALGGRPAQQMNLVKRRSILSTKNASKVKSGSQLTRLNSKEDKKHTYDDHQCALENDPIKEFELKALTTSDEMPTDLQKHRSDFNPAPVISNRSPNGLDSTCLHKFEATSTTSQDTDVISDTLDVTNHPIPSRNQDLHCQTISSTCQSNTVDVAIHRYAQNDVLWDINLDTDDETSEEDLATFHRSKSQHSIRHHFSDRDSSKIGNRSTKFAKYNMGEEHDGPNFPGEQCKAKLNGSSGQAPNVALPQLPSEADQWTTQDSSEVLGEASSFRDEQIEPAHIERKLVVTSSIDANIRSTEPASVIEPFSDSDLGLRVAVDHPPVPLPNVKDPYEALEKQDLFHRQRSDCISENPSLTPQLAHEREVSAALRRMGAFSIPSQDTPIHGLDNGELQSSTDSTGLLSFIYKQDLCRPEIRPITTQGFYHESAIHQTWLDSHQFERIRVPINRSISNSSVSTSHSEPVAASKIVHEAVGGVDDDGKDWETVLESGVASQPAVNGQRVICRVKKAGSSLANNSDEGIDTPILYQHSDFSSTDRIIQHPAKIEFSYDYRYRDMKESNLSVLLPSYKQPTFNRFPVDSYRAVSTSQNVSQGPEVQAPTPLSRSHTNPFRSSPPELLDINSNYSHLDNSHIFLNGVQQPGLAKYSTLIHTDDNDLNDCLNEHKSPMSSNRTGYFCYTRSATSTSSHSRLEAQSRTLTIGSSIADASTASLDLLEELPTRDADSRNGYLPFTNLGELRTQPQSIRPKLPTSPRRTPGALYEGIRSERKKSQGKSPKNGQASQGYNYKITSPPFPTNKIRALSLVESQRAQQQAVISENPYGIACQKSFLYRSPLAPVKSKSWRHLYNKDQLKKIRDAAVADGVYDLESLSQQSSRPVYNEEVRTGGAWRRLSWRPQMFAWPQENSSMQSDLVRQKTLLSTIVFASCCLFLPLLVLYGAGYMDSIMLWITNGEITTFGRLHKKIALQLGWISTITILIFITVFVAIKAATS